MLNLAVRRVTASLAKINWKKTGDVRISQHWGAFVQPLLLWKSNECYTTWVCVFVDLGMEYAMRKRHIIICGLPRSNNTFPHYLTKGKILEKKKGAKHKMCFDFLYNFCLKHFSFSEEMNEIWFKKKRTLIFL